MDSSQLRAWWWQLQGLDGSLTGASPAAALERAGWARSVGGAGPYLSIFARTSAFFDAGAGAVSMMTGSAPAVAIARIFARGFRPALLKS